MFHFLSHMANRKENAKYPDVKAMAFDDDHKKVIGMIVFILFTNYCIFKNYSYSMFS